MRKPIFDAIRAVKGPLKPDDVAVIDAALDRLGIPHDAETRRSINAPGLALIKEFEGCKLTAYKCPAGIWTVGYGSTGDHVSPGMTITQAQAEGLLRSDLRRFEDGVAKLAKVATDNQFSALVSFAFNLGLESLKTSTLLRKHNEGDYAGARIEFAKWNKARVNGGALVPLAGLTRRRTAEAILYGATA